MVGFPKNSNTDLLGTSQPNNDLYSPAYAEPGKTVDLSGASSFSAPQSSASSFGPSSGGGSSSFSSSSSGFGGGSSSGFGGGSASGFGGSGSRGPTSIEGGSGPGFSLQSLNVNNVIHQLTSRPVTELVTEQGKNLINIPKYMARTYQAAAKRYLKPWSEFGRIRPAKIIEGMRNAGRRGEIQIHIQRNILANARAFCPNYAFLFIAFLFMFVCTSPMLLCMLGAVGGGWSHAMRNESFRNKPWTLQIGGVQVPLGANSKMALMSLPTLFLLHFLMGPVLWSAALYSGGMGLAHAALRDRDDDRDDDHGDSGGFGGGPSLRIGEMP